MDITLVTASNSKEVHGTDNDKKTGCGINLLRGENVTIYRRIGRMTDLKEITCERCKANLAKKMIRSDKKEMNRLLKEEKQRAKLGMDDEGIVPLGNTTAKITRAPERREEIPRAARTVPAGSVPEGNYNASAAPNAANQYDAAPAPAPVQQPSLTKPAQPTIPGTGVAIDASLAAFAIQKPAEEKPAEENNDFLAQFAVPTPAAQPAAPAPAAPQPAQNDFLAQFAIPTPAAQPAAPAPAPQPAYQTQAAPAQTSGDNMPNYNAPQSPVLDSVDDILSMFAVGGGAPAKPAPAPVQQYSAPVQPAAPAFDTIAPVQPAAPAFDAIAPVQPAAPAFDSIAPMQPAAPVLDDIAPIQPTAPLYEEMAPVQPAAPLYEDAAPAPLYEDMAPLQPTAPVLDDLAPMQSVAPEYDPTSSYEDYMSSQPAYDAAPEAAYDAPADIPVYEAEQPAPVDNSVSQQLITVPQFTGYDANGRPVYNYIQMAMTGVDQNGQPIFAPIDGQPFVQAAPAAAPAKPAPVRPEPYRFSGTANANISKIAVNPHMRQTSQAFINAIASSKEYADKNLIDTQGLKANTPVLSSIEDVLSTMGDDSLKLKKMEEQQNRQKEIVPKVDEYRGPVARSTSRSVPPQSRNSSYTQPKDPRTMTKSELKAYKKTEKINAKFKKDLAKRGF